MLSQRVPLKVDTPLQFTIVFPAFGSLLLIGFASPSGFFVTRSLVELLLGTLRGRTTRRHIFAKLFELVPFRVAPEVLDVSQKVE